MTMRVHLEDDLVDPRHEDWRSMDDAALWHAAQAKIPQAVDELARRERQNIPVKAADARGLT